MRFCQYCGWESTSSQFCQICFHDTGTAVRARDSKRAKVYAWEAAQSWWWSKYPRAPNLSFFAAQALVDKIWAEYGDSSPAPAVRFNSSRWRWARGSRGKIFLPRWAQNVPVLLHEISHSVITGIHGYRPAHGPAWLRLFAKLVSQHLPGVEEADVLASAIAAGLLPDPATFVAPPGLNGYRPVAWLRRYDHVLVATHAMAAGSDKTLCGQHTPLSSDDRFERREEGYKWCKICARLSRKIGISAE